MEIRQGEREREGTNCGEFPGPNTEPSDDSDSNCVHYV